jgi:hypothetical protein
LDRRSRTELLRDDIFDKILQNLSSIGYDQSLVWSRYHEPMAHPSFFDRVQLARRRLPKAFLTVVSNGDYFNRHSLKALEAARVDRLLLDMYLPRGKERDIDELQTALERFRARTDLDVSENGSKWEYKCAGSTMNISMGVPLYAAKLNNISTRGGLVDVPELIHYQRRSICFNPLHSVVVDYNGKVVLCCQVRSDAPVHADSIIGDLSKGEYSLFDAYRDLAPARLGLLSPGPKSGPCKTCTISDGGPDRLARRSWLAKRLTRLRPLRALFELAVERASEKRKWES